MRIGGHEWKLPDPDYNDEKKAISYIFHDLERYFEGMREVRNIKFDPNDLEETFPSLEAKRQDRLNTLKSSFFNVESELRKYHVEAVMQFIKKHYFYFSLLVDCVTKYPYKYFVEWGCKTFPRESLWMKFWYKLGYRRVEFK